MTMSMSIDFSPVPEIGRYHILAEIAQGGMGLVYLAVSQGPGRFRKLVAMKELKPQYCDNETFVAMFLEEARLAARLVHPNIVQTYEVGSDSGRHFMVMEYLDGRSLSRIAKRLGARFPVGAHLRVIGDALLGLHYAHELRGYDGDALAIVHRDVSPLNVLVTFHGEAKMIDFGISKAADTTLETKTGVLKGRVAYMSPEQALGLKVDRRADIYSVGVMLWEAAARRRLWPQIGEVEILKRLVSEPSPSLRSVCPDAPEDLDRICARAMAMNRDERYATAAELLADLEEHLAGRDDCMSVREVGSLVSDVFSDERYKMNEIIEETLARVQTTATSTALAVVGRPLPAAPTGSYVVSAPSGSYSASAPSGSYPVSAPQTPSDSFGPRGQRLAPLSPTTTSLEPEIVRPRTRPHARRAAAWTAVVGVMALGVLLLAPGRHARKNLSPNGAIVAHGAAELAAVAEEPGGAEPAAVAEASGAPRAFHVVVSASPKLAEVYVDDVSVGNPWVADRAQDATPHRVRVEAAGYKAKTSTLAFDDDVNLKVTLEPVHASWQPPRRAARLVSNGPPSPIGSASATPNGAASCDPPYVVDSATGARRWRLECL